MSGMTSKQKLQLAGLLAGLVIGIYLLGPVLTPFAISALVAYLCDPLVDKFEARGLPRTAGVIFVFLAVVLLLGAALLVLVPMLERQITNFIQRVPTYLDWIQNTALPWIERRTGLNVTELKSSQFTEMLPQQLQQGGIAAMIARGLSTSGLAIWGLVINLITIPVVTFYLLRDWDVLAARIGRVIPRNIKPTLSRLGGESEEVLGAFLRGQLTVMVALGAIYSMGLWAVGIDLALLIGMLAGLISIVPYLGTFVGGAAAIVAALVQYGDSLYVLMVLGVFVTGQMLEGMVLTPWIVGDRIGLHPVAVIFAVLAGGQLFGFLGILLALPVASVAMVVLRYFYQLHGARADEALIPAPGGAAPVGGLPPLSQDGADDTVVGEKREERPA
jgi:predicted PurR-regulated permease PerM